MTRLPCAPAGRPMPGLRQDFGIGRPKVSVEYAYFVAGGDALPQEAAGRFASIADGTRNDLTGFAPLGQPHPAQDLALVDEEPKFIEFQHIVAWGRSQSSGQKRQVTRFF